jgi:hypothetical protein
MAYFNFTSAVLDEGTTFIFGSWICPANGSGGFNSHLANSKESETSSSTPSSDLNDFIDNVDDMLLPDLAQQIEKMSVFNATSTHDIPDLFGSDSNRSEKTSRSKSLSDLEENLDLLLKIKDVGATTCRGAPIFDTYPDSNEEYSPCSTTPSSRFQKGLEDEGATACRTAPTLENHSQPNGHTETFSGSLLGLTITSMPQGRFVYWKDYEPSELKPASPPASPTSPIQRTSNQSESPSMTVSRTRASGFIATPSPLKFQGDPTLQKICTFRWLWSPRPSRGLKASSQTPSTRGRTSSGPSSITSSYP